MVSAIIFALGNLVFLSIMVIILNKMKIDRFSGLEELKITLMLLSMMISFMFALFSALWLLSCFGLPGAICSGFVMITSCRIFGSLTPASAKSQEGEAQ